MDVHGDEERGEERRVRVRIRGTTIPMRDI